MPVLASPTGRLQVAWKFAQRRPLRRSMQTIQATQIDWKRFFAAMNVSPAVKQTSGIIGIFAKLRSSGGDQRQMFANMSGEISVFVRDAILGGPATSLIDLRVAEGLGLAERGQRVLPIPCGIGHFLVSGGVATAETLLLATSSTNILGAGNINFADETLFLDLKPQPKPGGASLGNVRVPIRIRGTFGRREISADKGGLASRLGAALGLAPVEIPAPLLPLLERGLGRNACASSFVSANVPGGAAGEGSSAPSERARPSNR